MATGTACDHCGKTAEDAGVAKLLTCGGCKLVSYCTKACQTQAWKSGHKSECRKRKKPSESPLPQPPAAADGSAQYRLGLACSDGLGGVPRDPAAAAKMFEMAAVGRQRSTV